MRAYILNVERFDPTKPPNNIRHERCVVLATVKPGEGTCQECFGKGVIPLNVPACLSPLGMAEGGNAECPTCLGEGTIPVELVPTVFAVYNENDLEPQDLGKWAQAERAALYELIRKVERRGLLGFFDIENGRVL